MAVSWPDAVEALWCNEHFVARLTRFTGPGRSQDPPQPLSLPALSVVIVSRHQARQAAWCQPSLVEAAHAPRDEAPTSAPALRAVTMMQPVVSAPPSIGCPPRRATRRSLRDALCPGMSGQAASYRYCGIVPGTRRSWRHITSTVIAHPWQQQPVAPRNSCHGAGADQSENMQAVHRESKPAAHTLRFTFHSAGIHAHTHCRCWHPRSTFKALLR